LELNDYLAGMAGLLFIYIIVWYMVSNAWISGTLLNPISQLLGLAAILLSAIFVVEQIREM
jgi:hypothetical protein